jgi:hypothetical protein
VKGKTAMEYKKYQNQTTIVFAGLSLTMILLPVVFLIGCNTNNGLAVTNEKRSDVG